MKPFVPHWVLAAGLVVAAPAHAEPPEAPLRDGTLARRGDASVSLGIVRARRAERAELAAYVGVTVPLDRLALRRSDSGASSPSRELGEPDAGEGAASEGEGEPERAASLEREEADGGMRGVLAPAVPPELLSRLARDAVAAAANAGHLVEREDDLDGLSTRARWSAVMPEVRLRAARSRDDSLHLQPTIDDPYRYSTIGGDGLLIEGQVTFRLNRLVFADEEVAVERLRIARERVGEERALRVTARIVRWHHALSRERSAAEPEVRGRAAVERVETAMELDVLTGGWFGERIRRLGLEASPVERLDPAPKNPAPPKPAPKTNRLPPPAAVADLDARPASATSASPCLPKLATDSKTFCGALTR